MKTEKTSPPTLESWCQQFNLNDVTIYEVKEGTKTVKVIWIENVDLATKKLSEIVEKQKPKILKCEWGRPHDEGGYAKITFELSSDVRITGTVFFANLLGDFEKTLSQNGYQQENYVDVSWGMCDYTLICPIQN